jgi:hypothetical protein
MSFSRRSLWLAAVVLATLPLAGCTDGGECDTCTTDEDCKSGLVCSTFLNEDGTVHSMRCGSGSGTTQCRVR